MTALAWLLLIAIAFSAAVVCLIPICAGILNNRAAASAVAKLRADGVFLDEDDPAWVAREAEWEALGIAPQSDEVTAEQAARIELRLASLESATDEEPHRLIEEAR